MKKEWIGTFNKQQLGMIECPWANTRETIMYIDLFEYYILKKWWELRS